MWYLTYDSTAFLSSAASYPSSARPAVPACSPLLFTLWCPFSLTHGPLTALPVGVDAASFGKFKPPRGTRFEVAHSQICGERKANGAHTCLSLNLDNGVLLFCQVLPAIWRMMTTFMYHTQPSASKHPVTFRAAFPANIMLAVPSYKCPVAFGRTRNAANTTPVYSRQYLQDADDMSRE